MWVVQELAAAGNRALIGCGTKWIPWTPFVMASMTISEWKDHPFLQRLRRFSVDGELIGGLAAICYRADGRLNSIAGMMLLLSTPSQSRRRFPLTEYLHCSALLLPSPCFQTTHKGQSRPIRLSSSFSLAIVDCCQF